MSITVQTRRETARGCGWRKPGGLYLVGSALGLGCGRFPIACDCCPTCGQGIKPARGWTWIQPDEIAGKCVHFGTSRHEAGVLLGSQCGVCSFQPGKIGNAGLLWVGQQYYPTASSFLSEAATVGISRRINMVPRGLVVGETWVFLGHREAIETRPQPSYERDDPPEVERYPGIFAAFQPRAIEYVVTGDEADEELEALAARGFTLIRVERVGEQMETTA